MLEGSVNDNTTEVPKNRHMNSSNSVDMEEVTDIVELSWDMPISLNRVWIVGWTGGRPSSVFL